MGRNRTLLYANVMAVCGFHRNVAQDFHLQRSVENEQKKDVAIISLKLYF